MILYFFYIKLLLTLNCIVIVKRKVINILISKYRGEHMALQNKAIIKDDEVIVESDNKSSAENDYFTEKPDWKGIRFFTVEGRFLKVCFSKYYDNQSKEYEDFVTSCISKKAYAKMMRLLAHTNNCILNQNLKVAEAFIYKYFCIKFNIDNKKYDDKYHSYFINAIVNLFNFDIINEIRKYVRDNFNPEKNVAYDENKDFIIPGITFFDYHIKLLYIVSCMTHFIIPLCLEYIRSYRNVSANNLLIESFLALFPIAQTVDKEHLIPIDDNERPVDLYQKLYSFVEHKVKQTFKSDALMWERQAYLGVNYKTTIEDTTYKIITNIIPEYQFDGNIMSLNTAVIRISIQDYTLRKKDPFNIKCFVDADPNTQSDDNNIVAESEQFDSYSSNHDEFAIIIRHTFAQDTVNKILLRKGVTINPDELTFYLNAAANGMTVQNIHEFQQFAIFSAFYQYFGGTENIYGVNLEQWITLMLAICETLKKNGIPELCKYITGIRNKHYIQKKEARISRQQLYLDPMYNHIVSTKYRAIKSIIDKKKNFIESNILLLTTNEYTYNTPDPLLNGKVIVRNDDEIRSSILSFFQNIIN
jgi:hypothetical protein